MVAKVQPTLLTIGIDGLSSPSAVIDVYAASTIREAMSTMRLIGFDLVVVGLDRAEIDVWEIMHRVLTAWPQQRWLVASDSLSQEEEILARSLGAALVLDSVPDETWLAEFASSLRRRGPEAVISPLASSVVLQGDWRPVEA
ncbi:hypothetical protein [Lacipirellula parvula]|uniref:Response regulatory domain-containing protein n=1 Tax=Lacipirellula parvula TaxID=2650471 RepID=A0A5K7XMM0_9BACT|nr:hypothetical protein [Lacipirellula parvula]BBO36096.1 hypothetical protein PLANPX_5708 [Lacipirellula parvula]